MSVGFWSVDLKAGKSSEVQVPEGYVLCVQNMALMGGDKGSAFSVFVETEGVLDANEGTSKSLLATLRTEKAEQFQSSLVFGYDVPLSFSVQSHGGGKSNAVVYLTGYIQPGPSEEDDDSMGDDYGYGGEFDMDDDDDDDDSDEEENMAMRGMAAGEGDSDDDSSDDSDPRVEELSSEDEKPVKGGKGSKRKLVSEEEANEEGTDSDSEDDRLDEELINKMIKKQHTSSSSGTPKSEKKQQQQQQEPSSKKKKNKNNKKGKK
jgi:hypothetical protein